MYRKKTPRKGQKNLQKLGDFLERTLKRRKIHIDIRDSDTWNAWRKAVGPQISAQTEAYKLKNRTLFVRVSTSTWMQELQFMKQDIIEKVNSVMEKETIQNIHFSLGHIEPVVDNEKTSDIDQKKYTLRAREERLIKNSLDSTISDGELKTILQRVMAKEIINRRMNEDS
jgi:hypothetical protein